MPTCEILTIGSELLDGSVTNSNARYLAEKLSALDFDVQHQTSCQDLVLQIIESLHLAIDRSDLIIVTGGLGPTPDDVTREAISKFLDCGLKFNPDQYRQIVRYFKTKGEKTPLLTRREAHFPEMAQPLLNPFGIALGFFVERAGRLLIVLPGVPKELVSMFESSVSKLIKKKFKDRKAKYGVEARTIGCSEVEIMRRLGKHFFKDRNFVFGIYPLIGQTTVRIKTAERSLVPAIRRDLIQSIGKYLYSLDGQSIEEVIRDEFTRRRLTFSCAESCTGGGLVEQLTCAAGSSTYFLAGLVSYSNRSKSDLLGVPAELIKTFGAVSSQVGKRMASGVRERFHSSCAISITGIAGPGGGSAAKPVGLVYIGFSDADRTSVYRFRFAGDREHIRAKAVQKAIELLWFWVKGVKKSIKQ